MTACSDSHEDTAQDPVETTTEEIGQEAARMIKTPLEKAQATADSESERLHDLEERLDTD